MKPIPDAVQFFIDSDYKQQAQDVLDKWQEHTGFELEEDNIVKLIARDVNNYAEIVQVGDNDYEIHYKGGELTRGEHEFKWNKEKKIFEYTFKDSLKSNSLSIVSEALLKKLLFDIPIEKTINDCDDIFRFQMISHLGSTYEKMVQESDKGDIEIQKNNRIYAGLKPSGAIIKVKSDGRRDSLANCPPNPIVDNANECNIQDINKEWYIEFANEKYTKFVGGRLIEEYKKDELLELAKEYNIIVDKKLKKSELVDIIKKYKKSLTNKVQYDIINKKKGNEVDNMATKQELEEKLEKSIQQNEKLVEKLKEMENNKPMKLEDFENERLCNVSLLKKINEFRKEIRKIEFIFDKELPSNLGGGEYYSIDQFYNAVQETAIQVGLDFSFETTGVISFEKELVKPSGRLPIHVATVETLATFTDLDTGASKEYITIAQGSDTIDKAISGASTLAFRQWFYKNFTPKNMNEDDLDKKEEPVKSEAPKVPVYVPETKKEEIKKEVVKQVQQESTDDEDIKEICENIMKIRKALGDDEYGAKTLEKVMSGKLSDADIMEIDLKIKNKMEKVGL